MRRPDILSRTEPVLLQAALIFVLGAGIYLNTLTHGYVLDDTLMITENSFTKQGVSGIPDILTNDALTGFFGQEKNLLPGGRYRPLSHVMFAVEYELWGLDPLPGHLINILLYALGGALLFLLLRKLLSEFEPKPWYLSLPFVAAVLFVVHPLHTEVVANIKGRDEILALWGFLGSTWFTLRWYEKRRSIDLLWVFLIASLALLAKESAITYAAAVPLTLWFFRPAKLRDVSIMATPFVLALVAYFSLRFALFGGLSVENPDTEILNNPFVHASALERLATVMMTWLKYYGLMLVPWPLTHDYYPHHLEVVGFDDPKAILGLLVTLGLLIYAVLRFMKRDPWAWSIVFFFAVFSIYSNLLVNIGAFMNERFVFLPLLGFTVALGMVFHKVLRIVIANRVVYKRFTLLLFALVTLVLSGFTINRNFAWKDNLTLFTTDVKVSANSAKCNVSAGESLIIAAKESEDPAQRKAMLNKAVRYLQRGAQLHPGYYGAWDKLSLAYLELEEWGKAIRGYQQCMSMRANDTVSVHNLRYIGEKCLRQKDYTHMEDAMRTLLRFMPDDAEAMKGLGIAMLETLQPDSAFYYLSKAVELDPDDAGAWNKLAEYHGRYRGDLTTAGQLLEKAYNLDPENANVLENLGVMKGLQGRHAEALQWFLKAWEANPGNENLITNLVTTYQLLGQPDKAAEWAARLP